MQSRCGPGGVHSQLTGGGHDLTHRSSSQSPQRSPATCIFPCSSSWNHLHIPSGVETITAPPLQATPHTLSFGRTISRADGASSPWGRGWPLARPANFVKIKGLLFFFKAGSNCLKSRKGCSVPRLTSCPTLLNNVLPLKNHLLLQDSKLRKKPFKDASW